MNILLVGNGNMGKIIQSIAKDNIVKVIEKWKEEIFDDDLKVDVIIDFSNRENIKYIYEYSYKTNCKVVIATTDLIKEDYDLLLKLSKKTAVMIDSNYSYGVTIIKKILRENISLLNNYDIELLETHHKYKKDSPSGTMKSIEQIIKEKNIDYNITSIRAGTIRGEHQVIFYGDDEYIEIKHTSLSRKIFALGALKAAKWLLNQEKGLFSYEDCIFNKKI